MALAEKLLAAQFNRPGHAIVDHRTYVFVGDGCLMEGISHEACSLAGTLGLGKLIVLYDDNGISIDGEVRGWFTDDTPQRFDAYGWNVIANVDGHDVDAVDAAIARRAGATDRPDADLLQDRSSARARRTRPAPPTRTARRWARRKSRLTRAALGWTHPPFEIPAAVYAGWNARACGARSRPTGTRRFAALPRRASRNSPPSSRAAIAGELPADLRGAPSTRFVRRAGGQGRDASPRARRRSRRSRPSRRRCRKCSAARPT